MTNTTMTTETFCEFFETEDQADAYMRMLNRAFEAAGNKRDTAVVVDGPEDNYAVVDIDTAIELGGGYRWAV